MERETLSTREKSKKKNQKNYPEDTVFGGNSGHEKKRGYKKNPLLIPWVKLPLTQREDDTHRVFFQWSGLGKGVERWEVWVDFPILHVCCELM